MFWYIKINLVFFYMEKTYFLLMRTAQICIQADNALANIEIFTFALRRPGRPHIDNEHNLIIF